MTEESNALREIAKKEQFAALGKFIQDFELVCDELRSIFISSFHRSGLPGSGQILASITIKNQYITADPLVSIVSVIYSEVMKSDQVAIEVMRDVEKRFKKLIEVEMPLFMARG
ncbi:MAG: hypothetical protein IPK23_02070 [Rhizobiales bacterium]|nr:hypothetical protein [Hyphomicrobiales bacterium]